MILSCSFPKLLACVRPLPPVGLVVSSQFSLFCLRSVDIWFSFLGLLLLRLRLVCYQALCFSFWVPFLQCSVIFVSIGFITGSCAPVIQFRWLRFFISSVRSWHSCVTSLAWYTCSLYYAMYSLVSTGFVSFIPFSVMVPYGSYWLSSCFFMVHNFCDFVPHFALVVLFLVLHGFHYFLQLFQSFHWHVLWFPMSPSIFFDLSHSPCFPWLLVLIPFYDLLLPYFFYWFFFVIFLHIFPLLLRRRITSCFLSFSPVVFGRLGFQS